MVLALARYMALSKSLKTLGDCFLVTKWEFYPIYALYTFYKSPL